ncbi:ankyrin repeat domain-containing protein 66 [Biomphalaria glabrata]|uniref:Ankyrin repeat domain-containing protein 66-like n=1 Tax=Biomphalaria glabrata TaxID=6526 RepID=A0A9U8E5Y7_BIOGL|nr:ankyrin repeat domain-containing protein 66-like [Biomphalaria glabrata]XP_013073944.2 ankyrin repeat domain-containing protein 66-like [Biomphalaria glabrata]KAI8750099.1 ankyrin repeat domain-containing protein 66-like [Biomphalaria glabrata]
MTSMIGLEIHEAASLGDHDALEEYIKSGRFDINQGDLNWGDKTPLHWASQKGFAECVRLLLDNGAFGLARTETGWTPAHFAAESGRITVLRALHASNVRVDKKDNYGCTPRRLAEIYDHQDCIKFLQQAEQEIAERRHNLGLLNSSDEEDDLETMTSITFATEEKSGDDVTRSSSHQRRRKDRNSSPSPSEGRKSRASDKSSASNDKRKKKDKKSTSPNVGKKNKNRDMTDADVTKNFQSEGKKNTKSKETASSPQSEEKLKKQQNTKQQREQKIKYKENITSGSKSDDSVIGNKEADVKNEGKLISIEEMFNTDQQSNKTKRRKDKKNAKISLRVST